VIALDPVVTRTEACDGSNGCSVVPRRRNCLAEVAASAAESPAVMVAATARTPGAGGMSLVNARWATPATIA